MFLHRDRWILAMRPERIDGTDPQAQSFTVQATGATVHYLVQDIVMRVLLGPPAEIDSVILGAPETVTCCPVADLQAGVQYSAKQKVFFMRR
jgi:hypothetical protein